MGKFQITVGISALIALPQFAFAGAANANLNCSGKSEGAGVILSGSIPGDFAEFELTLSHKGQRITMRSEQDRINTITAFPQRAFAVTVALADYSDLQLYALPKSISYNGSHGGGELSANFMAVLSAAPKPFGSSLSGVEMSCSYAYAN